MEPPSYLIPDDKGDAQAPTVFNVDGGRVEWFNDHQMGPRRKSCCCDQCGQLKYHKGHFIVTDKEEEFNYKYKL